MRRYPTGLALAAAIAATLASCLPAATSSQAAAPPLIRVMPLGDSITAGLGSTTEAGYRLPLWNRIAGQSRYRVDFVGSQHDGAVPDADHEGHRGWFINQIRANIDTWHATAQPATIILHIGINDLAWGADPTAAAAETVELVNRIYALNPNGIVILLGLIPTSGDPALRSKAAAYNAQIRYVSQRRFYYMDAPALTSAEMADELHPNDAGYQRIGDALYTVLNRAEISRLLAGRTP